MAPNSYANILSEGRELTQDARSRAPVHYRDDCVAAVIKALGAGRSVLLVGPPGVGKTSVVHALALHLKSTGPRKLYEFATAQLLSGTVYLGEWQSKLAALLDETATSRAILYFSDVWNLVTVGRTSGSAANAWDAMRPKLLAGRVQLIGEVTREHLLALAARPDFTAPFEIVEVPPLDPAQIAAIVHAAATRLELQTGEAAIARVLELCHDFLPSAAGPGPALQLLQQARQYLDEKRSVGEDEPVDAGFVEKVFSIHTGLPRFVVSRREVRSVREIRDWFRARIVGQRDAIDTVVQMVALFKAGLHDPQRPIGSFLFVGPTGVGKTELARALATYLFGSEKRLLRFDMSEFKDYHAFQMLIGDPGAPERPARLVDPVRTQPFQVVLFDEIEKAHPNVWDLLLQLLDDGRLTPARGPAVNFRNTIVIATSNVGALALERPVLGFTGGGDGSRDDGGRLIAELEAVFRPELINRFQHVVRFRRLTRDEAREIARAEIARMLEREGIVARKLVVDVDDEVLDLSVARGYDERYGARALKRQIQQLVIMPIATLLLERPVEDASILRLTVRHGEVNVAVAESEGVRERRREAEPLRLADGRRVDREALERMLAESAASCAATVAGVDLEARRAERAQLEAQRVSDDLWSSPQAAAALLERCDRLDRLILRITQLEGAQLELQDALRRTDRRAGLGPLAERIRRHVEGAAEAHRELMLLGAAGEPPALLVIAPLGRAAVARDLLHRTYREWAGERQYRLLMVREPRSDDEPVILQVCGPWASGYLRGEAGLHRVRGDRDTFVVRVGVAPCAHEPAMPQFSVQRALKQVGQYGGRIRSRLEVRDSGFVVQNAATLAENRELAAQLAPSWAALGAPSEAVVRRYDLEPFLLKDFLTDFSTGRPEVLHPQQFHRLLCSRIEAAQSAQSAD